MTDDRQKILVEHRNFDWSQIEGATLKEAGEYLLKLAETLPSDAFIEDNTMSYDPTEIRVVSYRDETDDEYTARKEREASAARLKEAERREKEKRKEKEAQYQKLKRELGYF